MAPSCLAFPSQFVSDRGYLPLTDGLLRPSRRLSATTSCLDKYSAMADVPDQQLTFWETFVDSSLLLGGRLVTGTRSSSGRMSPSLPTELRLQISGGLHDSEDVSTLKSLALVSQDWRTPSQVALYKNLRVRCSTSDGIAPFVADLQNSDVALEEYIAYLTVYFDRREEDVSCLLSLPRFVPTLHSLEALVLRPLGTRVTAVVSDSGYYSLRPSAPIPQNRWVYRMLSLYPAIVHS